MIKAAVETTTPSPFGHHSTIRPMVPFLLSVFNDGSSKTGPE